MTKEELRQQFFEATGTHWSTKPLDYSEFLEQRLLLSSEAEKGEAQEIPGFEGTKKALDELWIDRIHGVCAFDNCICETNEHRSRCSGWTLHKPSPPSPQEKQGVEECNHEWEFIGSVGDERCRFCGAWSNIDGTGSRYMIDRPAPAAHDKGEEKEGAE